MRSTKIAMLGLLLALCSATGCDTLKRLTTWNRPPANTAPLEQRSAGEFVGYLNQQAGYLRTIRYDDVSVSAQGPDGPMPRLGEGTLACMKPRNFRMMSGHLLTSGTEVDLGSNDQEFWMFIKRPEPTLLYASHTDFSTGKATLPIPFEPDWVLQALGMCTFDTNIPYFVDIDQKDRVYTLSWDTRTPQGQDVRKVIVFAGDRESGTRPQVRKHVVLDTNRKVIASAEVRDVQAMPGGMDPTTGQPTMLQIPSRVVLEWPQQKFKMDLTLAKPRVNEAFTPQQFQYFFQRPQIAGAREVNLSHANFRPSSFRGATPSDTARPRFFGSVRK
ncbi:MAG: hypothetical protein LC104_19500 [Bacteroidales bacterium]|nr:hypothetical protein [Bacteroidales bacterium]